MTNESGNFSSQAFWENYGLTPDYVERNDLIQKMIGTPVSSILDVGCGNGIEVNYLKTSRPEIDLVATDLSFTSHNFVGSPFVQSSLPYLPFCDQQFDLVLCLEVLEHIDNNYYKESIVEIQRLSKRFLIIGVPNRENLDQMQVMCKDCRRISHANGHLRSFRKKDIELLFPNFLLTGCHAIGVTNHIGTHMGAYIQHKVAKRYSVPQSFNCPFCGGTTPMVFDRNRIIHRAAMRINTYLNILSPKVPYWLICSYERKSGT